MTIKDFIEAIKGKAFDGNKASSRSHEQPAEKVIHHHIMKTAGTSFNSLLETRFPESSIISRNFRDIRKYMAAQNLELNAASLTKVVAKHNLICDHANFMRYSSQDHRIVTFLRDPAARVYSLYNDWRSLQPHDIEHEPPIVKSAKQSSKELSIDQFIKQDNRFIRRLFHNGMCVSLLDDPLFKLPQRMGLWGLPSEELFELAQQRVESFIYSFGLTEYFDESIALIYGDLGWQLPGRLASFKSLNIRHSARGLSQLTEPQKAIVRAFNQGDQQLYDWAKVKFLKRLENKSN